MLPSLLFPLVLWLPLGPAGRLVPPTGAPEARAAAGAGSVGAATRVGGAAAGEDSVWFITNRAFSGVAWRAEPGPLSFGLRRFSVTPAGSPDDAQADPLDGRLRTTLLGEAHLDREAFTRGIRERLPADGAVLVFVHGYASSIDEATEELAEMRRRAGFAGPTVSFAWPALRLGVTWPSLAHPFTQAYWRDSTMAAASAADFAAALADLARALGPDRVVLGAHSMGAQLVAAALGDPALRKQLAATPLRAIAFVSPDLDATHFREAVVPAARPLARRVALYGARDDRMLLLSSLIRGGGARAGRLGDGIRWPEGLEVVDMTDGRAADGALPSFLDPRHAIRRERTALRDLFGVVLAGAPAECRAALGLAALAVGGAWVTLDPEDGGPVAAPAPTTPPANGAACGAMPLE
jgi:esterase/lipase superfamily enzyme